jgi:hypothetical protein
MSPTVDVLRTSGPRRHEEELDDLRELDETLTAVAAIADDKRGAD